MKKGIRIDVLTIFNHSRPINFMFSKWKSDGSEGRVGCPFYGEELSAALVFIAQTKSSAERFRASPGTCFYTRGVTSEALS